MSDAGLKIDLKQDKDHLERLNELIKACKLAFQNYTEDKNALQDLIEDRDEQARVKEDLEFELEKANAQMNLLKNKMGLTDSGKLMKTVRQLEEERSEIKNDFMIKFASFSEEIMSLKSRLSVYEKVEQENSIASQPVPDQGYSKNDSQFETSVDYRAQYNLESTVNNGGENADDEDDQNPGGFRNYMASFFLTDTEMTTRVKSQIENQ